MTSFISLLKFTNQTNTVIIHLQSKFNTQYLKVPHPMNFQLGNNLQ